jgi:hypothetical protein
MEASTTTFETDRRSDGVCVLHFTPAEWRILLEDPSFLADQDNSYLLPRRLLGVMVAIVPDHRFG